MADKKISQLTAASTPLVGTEVLPIVQSGSTVKVANNDLRPKQIQSNATSGVLQVVGPAAASTRIMTIPDADFTVARTDAAQSFSGNQTFSTGNLVIGTSGKGIDFSATASGSGTMTSELLADYEEGTWTPVFVAATGTLGSITYENRGGSYTKIGNTVFVTCTFYTSAFAAGSGSGSLKIGGLPFTSQNAINSVGGLSVSDSRLWTTNNPTGIRTDTNATTCLLYYRTTANGGINNIQVSDAGTTNPSNVISFGGCYTVA